MLTGLPGDMMPDREERAGILARAEQVLHHARNVVARCDATEQHLKKKDSSWHLLLPEVHGAFGSFTQDDPNSSLMRR